jgi:hypothetical protein
MTLVGSAPTLALGSSTDQLINGQVHLADVTVTANSAGSIRVDTIPLTVNSTGLVTIAGFADNLLVKVNNANITTTNSALSVSAGGSGNSTITVTGGYIVPANQSVTFGIYGTASNVGTTLLNPTAPKLSTRLGVSSLFTWDDIVGGNVTPITGSAIFNYPTNSSIITN